MRAIGTMLLVAVFVANAKGTVALNVLSYTNSTLSSIAQKSVNGLVSMADHTGELKGDGQQHVVFHDGTTLIGYSYATNTLNTSVYRVGVPTPVHLVTGGHVGSDAYSGDSVVVYDSTGTASVYAGTGLLFSFYRGRSVGTGFLAFGLGNVINDFASDELLGVYTDKAAYAYRESGVNSLAGTPGSYNHMYVTNANLMDTHQLDMSTNSLNDRMVGFDESGTWLVLLNADGSYLNGRADINVNAGETNEALFLVAGNVHSYQHAGPEEAVVYRKDGSIEAWSAKTDGTFTTAVNPTSIGTNVTGMLLGDVLGDGIEEVVVSKGNTIEVWSLATAYAVLQASYAFDVAVVDFSLGDMDGDAKQDVIVGIVVSHTPPTITSFEHHSGDVYQMVVDFAADSLPSSSYSPIQSLDLTAGVWDDTIAHSTNGIDGWVNTNLDYSVSTSSNRTIYLQSTGINAFFGLGEN